MSNVNLGVQFDGDTKDLDTLNKQLGTNKAKLDNATIAYSKLNAVTGTYTGKLTGVTAAGKAVTVVFEKVGKAIEVQTVTLENNAKAAKKALDAQKKLTELKYNAISSRQLLEGARNLSGLSEKDVEKSNQLITQLSGSMLRGEKSFEQFSNAFLKATGRFKGDLAEEEHAIYDTIKRILGIEEQATAKAANLFAKQKKAATDASTRKGDAGFAKQSLEGKFNLSGLSPEKVASIETSLSNLYGRIEKGKTAFEDFADASDVYFDKATKTISADAQKIVRSFKDIDAAGETASQKASTSLQKQTEKGHAEVEKARKAEEDAARRKTDAGVARGFLKGAFNTSALSPEKVAAIDSHLSELAGKVETGRVAFKDFADAYDVYFGKVAKDISPAAQKIVSSFNTIGTAGQAAKDKAARIAQAKADKTANAATRAAFAQTTGSDLAKKFASGDYTTEQQGSVDTAQNRITRSLSKGTTTALQYGNALKAFSSGISTGLDEEEKRILRILKSLDEHKKKIEAKAAKKVTDDVTLKRNQTYGADVIGKLRDNANNLTKGLNNAAIERIRNQFERLQNLFNKGLNPGQFLKGSAAVTDGTIRDLTKLEQEVRHRIERINIELQRAPSKGRTGLGKIFGDGPPPGGPPKNPFGDDPTQIIKAAIFAEGITKVTTAINQYLEKSAEFSRQIALVKTITQDVNIGFEDWAGGITNVSNALGRSREEVASAGYDALSNQVTKGAETFQFLASAGNLANTTNSSLVDSTNLLSSAIQSFGLDSSDTDKLASKFFTTIDLGRVKISELANVFGRPALAAKTLGVSFEELAASIITISQTGIDAEQTNTLITNVFHKLINPTKELQQLYDKLGVSTGEMFVKTNGFTGVLKILQRETGGSVAKLAELFNEIRGEQGINALIDRLGIYEDSLDKVTNATEGYGKAIDIVNASAGQKFKVEIEKINNYFNEWKDTLLKTTIAVTEFAGGLSEAIKALTEFSVAAGAVAGIAYFIHRVDLATKSVGLLQLALNSVKFGGLGAAAAIAGAAVGVSVALIYQEYLDYTNRYNDLFEEHLTKANEFAEREKAITKAGLDSQNKDFNNFIKIRKERLLGLTANVIANIGTIAERSKEAFKDTEKALENNSQVFVSHVKKQLDTLRAEKTHADDLVKKINQIKTKDRDEKGDFRYEYSKHLNDLNTQQGYPDQSRRIDNDRIKQLRDQATKTLGDKDLTSPQKAAEVERLLGKALEIAHHQALTPHIDPVTGQYQNQFNALSKINAIKRQQLALTVAISNAEKAKSKIIDKSIADKENQVKHLEDALKKVTGFKTFNAEGKLEHGTKLDTERKYEEAVTEALKQLKASPGFDERELREFFANIGKQRAQLIADLQRFTDKENIQEANQKVIKASDSAVNKKLSDAHEAAKTALSNTGALAKAQAGALQESYGDITQPGPLDFSGIHRQFTEQEKELAKYLESITQLTSEGKFGRANDVVTAAQKYARENRLDQRVIPGQGRVVKDVDAKGVATGRTHTEPLTVGAKLQELNVSTNTAKEQAELAEKTRKDYEDNKESAKKYIEELNNLTNKYTDLIISVDEFRAKSDADMVAAGANVKLFAQDLLNVARYYERAAEAAKDLATASTKDVAPTIPTAVPTVAAPVPAKAAAQAMGGIITQYRSDGGLIYNPKGSDNIPVLASNHEFMMNQMATTRFLPQLIAMNSGFEPSFAKQGSKQQNGHSFKFGDINVHGGQGSQQSARDIVSQIKKELRRGTLTL